MAEKSVLGKGLASLLPGARPDVFKIQNTEDAPASHPASATGASTTSVTSATAPAPESTAASQPAGATSAGAATPAPALSARVVANDKIPGITMVDINSIIPNPHQPRRDFSEKELEELSQSIQMNGIIQPLIVRKTDRGFELIAGERRLRASKKAGLKQVPVVVRRTTDRESLELALIENIQRQDLNCVDEALAYFQLLDEFGLTQEKVAEQVGKERSTVANHLRLLRLPAPIIEDLKKGALTFGHGKCLAAIEDPELRFRAHAEIIEKGLSVRETEALVAELKEKKAASETKKETDATLKFDPTVSRLRALSQELTRSMGAKVQIQGTDKKGKIQIFYGSREDLDRILNSLQNESVWPSQST